VEQRTAVALSGPAAIPEPRRFEAGFLARMAHTDTDTNEDRIKAACLQLAGSVDAMRAASKNYLQLAQSIADPRDRRTFTECAIFYAQLANHSEEDDRPTDGKADGHW
jgi:hypothetical protein